MRSLRWSVVLVMCSTLAACGGATPAATVAPVTVESTPPVQGTPPGFPTVVEQSVVTNPLVMALLANLRQRGFSTELLDASRDELQPGVPGQAYRLGDGWLHVHVYPDAAAAAAAAAGIPHDPHLALLDWVAPPHYSQCDRLIVLYLGSEARVVEALSELCAPPFYTANALFAPAATAGR